MTDTTHPTGMDVQGVVAGLGLTARPFRDPADYGPMAALMCVANTHDDMPYLPTEEDLRRETDGADGLVPEADIVLVEDDMSLVAFAMVERIVRDGVPNYDLWGYVEPGRRRRGIGGALFAHNRARIATRAADEDPGASVQMRAHAQLGEAGHRALLEGDGFEPIRHFFFMRRTPLDDVPEVALPDGLELRTVTPAEHRAIWVAENEAFQDHWGAHDHTEHEFQVTFGHSGLDTDLWAVAWDGDQVAGVVQAWIWPEENARLGVQRGWLEKISVRRPWRKRGLGRALTAAGLARLRDAGMTEAMLGVDAENPTGALGLYERLGFEEYRRSIAYQRSLQATPTGTDRGAAQG